MAVFIDTCIFVAARNRRDINHRRAVELLKNALLGKYGKIFTSDYIFDEAVTVALARTKNPKIAFDIGNFILSSTKLKILHVDKTTFTKAWQLFRKYAEKGLSFTDTVSIALMKKHNITHIMTFDKHFEGITLRIH